MFVSKDPEQLFSSYCLLSTPWIVITQWLLCKWLPHGDSVGIWGLFDYIKFFAYLNFCKGSASDPSSSFGRMQLSNLQGEVKFQLRYHNVNDGSSKFYKSFRVNSKCICTITPLICHSFSLAAMCNSMLLEVCRYSVHNIILGIHMCTEPYLSSDCRQDY